MSGIITLGREAVISDTARKIGHAMNCFFFSKYSQSHLSAGYITSLTKILQENTDDPLNLKTNLQTKLTTFLEHFFTRVTVDVTVTENDDDANRLTVSIDGSVSDSDDVNATTVSIGYVLTYTDTVLREILETYSGQSVIVN